MSIGPACVLPSGGALLVAEMLLDEGGTSPPEVLLQSLNMLTQTHGRERRLSEYTHLLETAGFTKIEGKKTGGQILASITSTTSVRVGIVPLVHTWHVLWQTCLTCHSLPALTPQPVHHYHSG